MSILNYFKKLFNKKPPVLSQKNALSIKFTKQEEIEKIYDWYVKGSQEGAFSRSIVNSIIAKPKALKGDISYFIAQVARLPKNNNPMIAEHYAGAMFSLYLNNNIIGFISYINRNVEIKNIKQKGNKIEYEYNGTDKNIPIEPYMLYLDKEYRNKNIGVLFFGKTLKLISKIAKSNKFFIRCLEYPNSQNQIARMLEKLNITYTKSKVSPLNFIFNITVDLDNLSSAIEKIKVKAD